MHSIAGKRGSARRARATASALVLAATAFGACVTPPASSAPGSTPVPAAERDVLIGGLFALTGDWSSLSRNNKAAMEIAVEDLNRYLAGNPAHVRFVAEIEDTRTDPAVALEKAQALRRRGVQLMIGPQTSAEVARLKPFVDANDVFLISPSSTAGSLAIAGDNVFRFTPSDSLEGVAIAALMWSEGVRAIVPLWRDDAGNAGLAAAMRTAFTARGGTVLGGVKYAAGTPDFAAAASALHAELRRSNEHYGAGGVAIYLAGFDEGAELFARIADDDELAAVRWYGGDGMARSQALLANRRALRFAMRVGLRAPLFGLDPGARDVWQPLSARIVARTGVQPDAFALGVYDAVWVVGRAYVASGATVSVAKLKQAFTTAAATHFGATGWTVLNAAGDRKYGDFDFWSVRQVGGVPRWDVVAQFETRTGRVVRPMEVSMTTEEAVSR